MNKRGILAMAFTTMLLTSAIATPTNHSEFNTQEVKSVKEVKTEIKEEVKLIEKVRKPLTVTLPAKRVSRGSIKKTVTLNGEVYYYKREINIVATHYTNSVADCGNTRGITASGVRASRGMIAVPKNIPFGTEIALIDEGGNKRKVIAQDTGSAIKWIDGDTMKIDIFVPNATAKQISKLGVKHYTGYILEKIVETP